MRKPNYSRYRRILEVLKLVLEVAVLLLSLFR